MRIGFSLLFLLTVVILVMLRYRHKGDGLTILEFFLCGAWGFLLAQSSFAPTVRNFITAFAQAISR
ncbi:MAG TPA: hypothetical protein VE776_06525 [Actinomycetota bacterium]|nr:hypothetical protein [Actinomycetota bacterium]